MAGVQAQVVVSGQLARVHQPIELHFYFRTLGIGIITGVELDGVKAEFRGGDDLSLIRVDECGDEDIQFLQSFKRPRDV